MMPVTGREALGLYCRLMARQVSLQKVREALEQSIDRKCWLPPNAIVLVREALLLLPTDGSHDTVTAEFLCDAALDQSKEADSGRVHVVRSRDDLKAVNKGEAQLVAK
jgi:hypothetical protein